LPGWALSQELAIRPAVTGPMADISKNVNMRNAGRNLTVPDGTRSRQGVERSIHRRHGRSCSSAPPRTRQTDEAKNCRPGGSPSTRIRQSWNQRLRQLLRREVEQVLKAEPVAL
jgi:hypothetical protein